MIHRLTLTRLQRIKQWHVTHRADHPLEYQIWDVMLMLWVMGWVGWLPALILDALWAWPLCLLALHAPDLYVNWRLRAHRQQRLRCDWLDQAA